MIVDFVVGSDVIGEFEVTSQEELDALQSVVYSMGIELRETPRDSLIRGNPVAALATIASWTPSIIEGTKVAYRNAPKIAKQAKKLAKKAKKVAKAAQGHIETAQKAIEAGKAIHGGATKLQQTLRKRREEAK